MRQHHVAGDKVFVDYSGKTVPIVDRVSGEIRPAQLFVAVLGASNYTYVEASWTQSLPDWVGAHVRMFAFFQGHPRLVVPDNLKAGVHKPSFYDPEVNRSYARMAAHYQVGILPARPRRPRDKAKSLPSRKRGSRRVSALPNPTSSAGCATSPSSRSPSAMPRSKKR
jgi:transposase